MIIVSWTRSKSRDKGHTKVKTAGNITISCNTTLFGFCLGDKFNGSIFDDIRGKNDVFNVTFKVIWVSKSDLAASPAVYNSRIPRANQDKQNPPPGQSTPNRNKSKHVDSTKEDMHLLGQLCMTMHVREGSSDRMFEVENADCPPSLYKHGVLRSGQKSDLLSCL